MQKPGEVFCFSFYFTVGFVGSLCFRTRYFLLMYFYFLCIFNKVFTLQDILENDDIKLDNMFVASLVGDIIRVSTLTQHQSRPRVGQNALWPWRSISCSWKSKKIKYNVHLSENHLIKHRTIQIANRKQIYAVSGYDFHPRIPPAIPRSAPPLQLPGGRAVGGQTVGLWAEGVQTGWTAPVWSQRFAQLYWQ